MHRLGNLMHHTRMVLGMARSTGTDVVQAYDEGDLSQEDWASMVQACRGCGWADRCEDWLDDHRDVPCAPETCPNREKFKALKVRAAQR